MCSARGFFVTPGGRAVFGAVPTPMSNPTNHAPDLPPSNSARARRPAESSSTQPVVNYHQVRRVQNSFARLVGVNRWDREKIVGAMLKSHRRDAVSYWIELALSMGIATIGLVLNSTGVVIGAMLISPLMGPIVGLGMGLAVGSPFLTLRSLVRVGMSIIGVILLAALLTMLLPFHEVTPEIAARTSPTALDLIVAAFCALAAGYTTARLRSDTAAAAAGTAIGIALVPPLCVSGFGLGIAELPIFGGALLLFTANLCAIVFFSVLLFVALGFTMVDVEKHEASEIQGTGPVARIASWTRAFFGSRSGSVLRFLMPALLIASVYVPLRAALREVAWQVQVRRDIAALLDELAPQGQFVRTNFLVDQHKVVIRLVMMGAPERAHTLENELKTRGAALAGVVPSVEIVAVPDHESLRAVADSVAVPSTTAAPTVELIPAPDLAEVSTRVYRLIDRRWPEAAGQLIEWKIEFTEDGTPHIELTHTGEPLGPVATPLLAEDLSESLENVVELEDETVALGTWEVENDDVAAWLPHLAHSLQAARVHHPLRACVTLGPTTRRVLVPAAPAPTPKRRRGRRSAAPVEPPPPVYEDKPDPAGLAADAMLTAQRNPNVVLLAGERWAVTLTADECPTPGEPDSASADTEEEAEEEATPEPELEPEPTPAPEPAAEPAEPMAPSKPSAPKQPSASKEPSAEPKAAPALGERAAAKPDAARGDKAHG